MKGFGPPCCGMLGPTAFITCTTHFWLSEHRFRTLIRLPQHDFTDLHAAAGLWGCGADPSAAPPERVRQQRAETSRAWQGSERQSLRRAARRPARASGLCRSGGGCFALLRLNHLSGWRVGQEMRGEL